LRYAAMFFVIFTLGYLVSEQYGLFPWSSKTVKYTTVTVANGQRETIKLGDGTGIVLDAGTTLRYPDSFAADTREVYLDGEGYFEVAADTGRAFIIHANHAIVQVLGTKFNVRAWQPDRRVTVAVAAGKVSLRSGHNVTRDGVVINKGQMSILPENGPPSQPLSADVARYMGWLQNEVYFDNVALSEILYQMTRWYDVEFVIADSSLVTERLNLEIKNDSIDDILSLVTTLTDLKFVQHGRAIRLTR
jgi:ferric-dicitrate binding protein FerR (iron transport regulator)